MSVPPFGNTPSVKALKWLKQYKSLDQKRLSGTLTESEEKIYNDLQRKLSFLLDPASRKMAPKRKTLRVNTHHEIHLETDQDFQKVYLKNISGGGIYVETKEIPEVGTKVSFDLRLDESQKNLRLKGIVAWTNPKGFRGLPPGMGVKFGEMNLDEERFLQNLIHRTIEKQLDDSKTKEEESLRTLNTEESGLDQSTRQSSMGTFLKSIFGNKEKPSDEDEDNE